MRSRSFHALLGAIGILGAAWAGPALAVEPAPAVSMALDAETLWKKGRAAAESGALDEAVGFYRQSLAVDPHGRAAMVDLAIALTEQGRYDDARQTYERAVHLYPNDAVALNGLGYVHFRQDRLEAAIVCYRRAIARLEDPQFRLNLGLALLQQERFGQAEDEFLRVLEVAPNHYWAVNNLGYALERQGRHFEAAEAYAEATRLEPPGAVSHLNWGRLLVAERLYPDAAWVYGEALKRDDQSVEAHAGLAHALSRLGQFDQARREAALAVKLDARGASGWYALSEARFLGRDRAGGIQAGRRAAALAPASASYRLSLAKMLEHQGLYPEALAEYRAFLTLAPEDGEAPWARVMVRLLSAR